MKRLRNNVFQILSLTWCLMFWVVPALYFWSVLQHEPGLDTIITILSSVVRALILGYVPMVFLGVAPVVIVESFLKKKGAGALSISSDSWHAKIAGTRYGTLCSYCWLIPRKLIGTILLYCVMSLISVADYFCLCIYVWCKSWTRERNKSVTIIDVMSKPGVDQSHLFHPPRSPKHVLKVPSNSGLIKSLIGYGVDALLFVGGIIKAFSQVLSTLKQKACPRIEVID